jgi:hypothetical protein
MRRIIWHGGDADGRAVGIAFHQRCALAFAVRFMRDIHEADLDENITESGIDHWGQLRGTIPAMMRTVRRQIPPKRIAKAKH